LRIARAVESDEQVNEGKALNHREEAVFQALTIAFSNPSIGRPSSKKAANMR